ncbi:hypothetical protein [Herbiconiux sp. VKM Ac-2851]|jgi:hypothetical protein|uniref:hypothetical protein n=1 Tax=Herbiconiux sp. VKM Ac-2851 TaxID=2739025 RepID=UPI001565FCC4|nr:hypothetical protein [Herbiconiux sp. VKM Ac-2851]NQX33948.1 hypothetical protein [Herbiconiux sp. VKM Ac-2851]
MAHDTLAPTPPRTRARGIGRVLIAVYAILALGATGRSVVEIIGKFDQAPFAYTLSAVAAVVYIIATAALIIPGRVWYRIAWITITFELIGVLTVGTLSLFLPELFAKASVWSWYGAGYLFIPLVLPVLGMLWLRRTR